MISAITPDTISKPCASDNGMTSYLLAEIGPYTVRVSGHGYAVYSIKRGNAAIKTGAKPRLSGLADIAANTPDLAASREMSLLLAALPKEAAAAAAYCDRLTGRNPTGLSGAVAGWVHPSVAALRPSQAPANSDKARRQGPVKITLKASLTGRDTDHPAEPVALSSENQVSLLVGQPIDRVVVRVCCTGFRVLLKTPSGNWASAGFGSGHLDGVPFSRAVASAVEETFNAIKAPLSEKEAKALRKFVDTLPERSTQAYETMTQFLFKADGQPVCASWFPEAISALRPTALSAQEAAERAENARKAREAVMAAISGNINRA